jgi:proline iminopeptidase
MSCNTTEHLLSDMERLREHLDIDRWLLSGGSWGSTLILAYAERHPHRVSEIVISSVTTTRHSEIDWLYRGVARFFPRNGSGSEPLSPRPTATVTSLPPTRA